MVSPDLVSRERLRDAAQAIYFLELARAQFQARSEHILFELLIVGCTGDQAAYRLPAQQPRDGHFQQAVVMRAAECRETVHQGEVYIGARPTRYVGTAGQENELEFIAVDWEGEPAAEQEITIEIIERRWSSVQEEDPFGRTTWSGEG